MKRTAGMPPVSNVGAGVGVVEEEPVKVATTLAALGDPSPVEKP